MELCKYTTQICSAREDATPDGKGDKLEILPPLRIGFLIAADVEVVFAWQSAHRPVQRGSGYSIDAAYPDSLQPALLKVYKWAKSGTSFCALTDVL